MTAERIAASVMLEPEDTEQMVQDLTVAFSAGVLDGPEEFFELLPLVLGHERAAQVFMAYAQGRVCGLGSPSLLPLLVWKSWRYSRVATVLASRTAALPVGVRIYQAAQLADQFSTYLLERGVRFSDAVTDVTLSAAHARVSPVYYADAVLAGVALDVIAEAWLAGVPVEYLVTANVASAAELKI